CEIPSRSIRTRGGTSSFLGLSFSSTFGSLPFSSSLSGASGEPWSFASTTAYTLRVRGRLLLDMSNPSAEGPTSVLAAQYRYFPLRPQVANSAALIPSQTWKLFPYSSDYHQPACRKHRSCPLYSRHR